MTSEISGKELLMGVLGKVALDAVVKNDFFMDYGRHLLVKGDPERAEVAFGLASEAAGQILAVGRYTLGAIQGEQWFPGQRKRFYLDKTLLWIDNALTRQKEALSKVGCLGSSRPLLEA